MEKHLFSIIFMLNCFVLIPSFTGVISAPVTQMITDIMKKDTNLCNASKFLYDSTYLTEPCTTLKYPTASLHFSRDTINNFLCLGVYDTAYKICQYSNRLQISFNGTASLNSYMDNLVIDNQGKSKKDIQQEFCKNLEGLTSLYNKTSLYLKPLMRNLNKSDKCQKICFDFDDTLFDLCAVFSWIRSVENNMTKSNRNSTTPTQSSQSYDNSHNNTSEANKMLKGKEIQEPTGKQTTPDFNETSNKKVIQNTFGSVPSTNIKSDSEIKTSNLDESNKDKTQKTVDNTSIKADKKNNIIDEPKPNVEAAQSNKNILANNEVLSKNNAGNVLSNDNVNEGKSEDLKKKQNIDDAKTSTLSENTQDYDTNVMDDEIENGAMNDMNDVDDTVQQPNIGNENVQETFEKNNLRFSNLRTEDDSHFFTYFTVIAVMCIIGYIGYCNKQKIFAIVLEGRRSKNNRGRRRPSTASYRKLDCTLEEAVTSQCNANVTHVIY